ncbi:MAG: ATP-dependent zinc metalloprotease FtsH [Gammaproteobacteria bacterium]|nr:ATP-dependent zinc metalloprotease FtsH [Gammaproteobacteria bacterium]
MVYSLRGCSASATEKSYSDAYNEFILNSDDYTGKTKVVATPNNDSAQQGSYIIYVYVEKNAKETATFYFYATTTQYEEFINAITTNASIDYVVEYRPGSTVSVWSIVFYALMIGGFIFLIVMIFRASSSNGNSMNSTLEFTKSRARLNKSSTTTFKDVAGLEEEKEELKEVVDYLKNPKKYQEMGARVPKGILLYGKPGTGKTLLARAVAGEAGVPFFFTTGSDLVEMFVGVGASRVRDMFKTAKKSAPSILFMDEIDAVGRQRGTGLGGGNDEREQTLNQLLVEMDGFTSDTSVIVMAATNRPDILDPALLRPGRFDRQIDIGAPDVKEREAILKVHARNKKVDPSVDYAQVAHETPGFTGADLENVMNESALLAAREGKKLITNEIISEAIDRVMMGPAKKSRVISKKEREIVAHHEAGHCVIGSVLSDAEVVQKVTIIPRGQAGGYNLMGPKDEETFLYTKDQLLERITGLMGGRTAEELIYGKITTGASNDMEKATKIARAMVTEWGMSKLGPITYEENTGYTYLGRDYSSGKNFSDTVAHEIDEEIRTIINDCHNKAAQILTDNMDKLKAIAHYLLILETIQKPDIDEIMATGHLKRVDEQNASLKELGTESVPQEEVKEEVKEETQEDVTPKEENPKSSEENQDETR